MAILENLHRVKIDSTQFKDFGSTINNQESWFPLFSPFMSTNFYLNFLTQLYSTSPFHVCTTLSIYFPLVHSTAFFNFLILFFIFIFSLNFLSLRWYFIFLSTFTVLPLLLFHSQVSQVFSLSTFSLSFFTA